MFVTRKPKKFQIKNFEDFFITLQFVDFIGHTLMKFGAPVFLVNNLQPQIYFFPKYDSFLPLELKFIIWLDGW